MPLGCQNRTFLLNWKGWLLEQESSGVPFGRGGGVVGRWLLGYPHFLKIVWGLSQVSGAHGGEIGLMWPLSGRVIFVT